MKSSEVVKTTLALVELNLDKIPTKLRKRAANLQREARGLIQEAESLEIMKRLMFGEKEVLAEAAPEGGES